MPRVVGERHIPLRDSPRLQRCGIRHDAGRLGLAGAECGLCLQGLHKALLPQAQAERQSGRAGTAAEIQRKPRVGQRLCQFLQQSGVFTFQTHQKNSIFEVMAVGDIRRLSLFPVFLSICRMVIYQQLPFPLHPDAKAQLHQPGQWLGLIPPQAQRRGQQADHSALGRLPSRFPGLEFGIRAPCLQRRCQPKQQRCHYPTSFPASASRTAFSSASSIAFAVCAGARTSSPLPTVKLCAGASAKLLYICCAYCASAALEGAA